MLFADSERGGGKWAIIAMLNERCELCGADPRTHLADVLGKIVNDHPNNSIDDLPPLVYAGPEPIEALAIEPRESVAADPKK
jgi:hypothetical protein